jgi:hypothetical protein
MLVSFTMQAAVFCGCGATVPVNGIFPSVRCKKCGADLALDAARWKDMFEPGYFASALGFADGEGHPVLAIHRHRIAYGKRPPRCTCKGPDLDPVELMRLEHVFCPACGKTVPVRPADDLCRAIQPHAKLVVREHPELDEETAFYLVCEIDVAAARALRWKDEDNRIADASSPAITLEDMNALAHDEEEDVREALAANPAVPPEILVVLAGDEAHDVLDLVAKNPCAPIDALTRVVENDRADDYNVAAELGKRELPADLVELLARRSAYRYRVVAAKQASCSIGTLHVLAEDSDSDVRRAATERIAALGPAADALPTFDEQLARDPESTRRLLAANQSAPAETLAQLARDPSDAVREAAAGNPLTPPAELQRLACDKREAVRLAVAGNPGAPPAALQILALEARTKR